MAAAEGEHDEPVYLTQEDAVEIFAAIIGGTVQHARDQLRSRDALEGAPGRSESYAHYEQADLAVQAAVLAHGIAETRPVIDGNKRLALVAMLTFLELNDFKVKATDPELADWIIGFSRGVSPHENAELIRPRLTTAT